MKLKAIYNAVRLKDKIENEHQRLLYLSQVWGLQQLDIADIEGISQPQISRVIGVVKQYGVEIPKPVFTDLDLQRLHDLPREVLSDIALISFVQDVLKLDSWHVFYQWLGTPSQRMAALSTIGIKNMRIAEIFGKTSGTVSVATKRFQKQVSLVERPNRNKAYELLKIKDTEYTTKQSKAF